METKSPWSFAIARIAGALAFAVAGGLIFGRLDLWLVAVLGGYLLVQLSSLYQLHRWLRHRKEEDPPDLGGVWGDVVALVGSALTLLSMVKIWSGVFWGVAPEEVPMDPQLTRRGWLTMSSATTVMMSVTLAVALFAGPIWSMSERAAAELLDGEPYIDAVLSEGVGR